MNNILKIKLSDFLFFTAYGLYLIRALIEISTFQALIRVDGIVLTIVRLILYILIIFKVFILSRELKWKSFVIYSILTICLLASLVFNGYGFLIDFIALIIGANGIELKRIVKFHFVVTAFFVMLFFILSLSGVIENYGNLSTIRGARLSFGIIYPTDFAAMLFYLQLDHAYIKKKKYSIYNLIFWLGIVYFLTRYVNARLNEILICAFALIMFFADRHVQIFQKKFIRIIMTWAVPVLCACSIMLHILYSPSNNLLSALNIMLTRRLEYGKTVIEQYGITLFGQEIVLQGYGWKLNGWNDSMDILFVDCGYLLLLLRYGVFILLAFIISYTKTIENELKKGQYRLPLIICFIGVSAVVEPRIFQFASNSFIFVVTYFIHSFGLRRFTSKPVSVISNNNSYRTNKYKNKM